MSGQETRNLDFLGSSLGRDNPGSCSGMEKKTGVDFFAKGDLAGLINLHNPEHV